MTALVLPELSRSTVDELKKRIPDLSEIELPKMAEVGRSADEAVDRLLGRTRAPVWPWIAAGIGLVALIGAIAAYFTWFRRPSWSSTSTETAGWSSDETPVATETGSELADMAARPGGNPGLGAAAPGAEPIFRAADEA